MPIRLRDLSQGALLHVVVALLAGPMKVDQIALKTGKSHDSVWRALAALDREFGLVTAVPDGRWPIWSLRDTSQLELALPALPGSPAVHNPAVAEDGSAALTSQIAESACSSSSLTINYESKNLLLPVTPQIAESAEAQGAINQLTRMGATPGQAKKAITAALGRDESLATISQRIAALAEYAANRRSIRNPGQWALGYIATGCALPEDARPSGSDYSGYRPYLAGDNGSVRVTDEGEEGSEGAGEEGSEGAGRRKQEEGRREGWKTPRLAIGL